MTLEILALVVAAIVLTMQASGLVVQESDLLFLWLPTEELAVARVANRVRMGGHNIPENLIRRRYRAGLRNFFQLYRPLVDSWKFYDNAGITPHLIAHGDRHGSVALSAEIWHNVEEPWR